MKIRLTGILERAIARHNARVAHSRAVADLYAKPMDRITVRKVRLSRGKRGG